MVKIRVYALTELGRRIAKTKDGTSDELKLLQYLRENKTATGDELDIIGERWVVRRLKERGLVRELTT